MIIHTKAPNKVTTFRQYINNSDKNNNNGKI